MSDFDKNRMKRGAPRSLLDHVPTYVSIDTARPSPKGPPARSEAGGRQSLGDRIAELVRVDTQQSPRQIRPNPTVPVEHQLQTRPQSPEPQVRSDPQGPALEVSPVVRQPATKANIRQDGPASDSLDTGSLLNAAWGHRRRIALATLAGAGVGLLLALATPQKFHAETRLFIDPRDMQVFADGTGNQLVSTEAMLAITDGQVRMLSSTGLLSKVVEETELAQDAEFSGRTSTGGLSAGIALIKDILTKTDSNAETGQETLARLRSAVSVTRDPKTFIINVGVDSQDPEKSALIANRIVETYLDSTGETQSELMTRTTEQLNSRIDASQAELEAAETAVEQFKAENGIASESAADNPVQALGDELAAIRARKVTVRVKAETLARIDLDDVVSGAFPEEYLSPTILNLRSQYSQTKAHADSMATSLGPLHPQYIAAQSSLEAIRGEIRSELRRIVAASQTEMQRTVQTEQDLAQQMAVARVQSLDKSVDYAALRELERKATVKRDVYEAQLKRSRQASEGGSEPSRNAKVIAQAEPPIAPTGLSRGLLVAAGALAGLFASLAACLAAGAAGRIRSSGAPVPQAHIQPQPLAFDPPAPSVPSPAPAAAKPLPAASLRRRKGDAGHDDDHRDIKAEEAALIHAEAMRAAALTALQAASVVARKGREAENECVGKAAAQVAVVRPRADPQQARRWLPRQVSGTHAKMAATANEPQSMHVDPQPDWNAPSMAPPVLAHPQPQRQSEAAPQPQFVRPEARPAAVMFHPGYPQRQPHEQSEPQAPMAVGQQMPPQYPPQFPWPAVWPQLQPGWMGPQGFVPRHPQQAPWAPHPAGSQMMPQQPPAWPWPHPAFYWQIPVPAGPVDMAPGQPATASATTEPQSLPVATSGNVHAFDDIRRDLEHLRSKMASGASRRSA